MTEAARLEREIVLHHVRRDVERAVDEGAESGREPVAEKSAHEVAVVEIALESRLLKETNGVAVVFPAVVGVAVGRHRHTARQQRPIPVSKPGWSQEKHQGGHQPAQTGSSESAALFGQEDERKDVQPEKADGERRCGESEQAERDQASIERARGLLRGLLAEERPDPTDHHGERDRHEDPLRRPCERRRRKIDGGYAQRAERSPFIGDEGQGRRLLSGREIGEIGVGTQRIREGRSGGHQARERQPDGPPTEVRRRAGRDDARFDQGTERRNGDHERTEWEGRMKIRPEAAEKRGARDSPPRRDRPALEQDRVQRQCRSDREQLGPELRDSIGGEDDEQRGARAGDRTRATRAREQEPYADQDQHDRRPMEDAEPRQTDGFGPEVEGEIAEPTVWCRRRPIRVQTGSVVEPRTRARVGSAEAQMPPGIVGEERASGHVEQRSRQDEEPDECRRGLPSGIQRAPARMRTPRGLVYSGLQSRRMPAAP